MQKNTINDTIHALTFTAEGGGAKPKKSPPLEVKSNGVYLHFLRLGLFDKNTNDEKELEVNYTTSVKKDTIPTEQQRLIRLKDNLIESSLIKIDNTQVVKPIKYKGFEEKVTTLNEINTYGIKGLPNFENFYLHPTSLNEGYIYLIDDKNPSDCYELYVDTDGNLNLVDWSDKRNLDSYGKVLDIRIHSGAPVESAGMFPQGKKLWIAYSPTQWSKKYHTELSCDNEKRKKRMRLLDCIGIKRNSQQNKKSTKNQSNEKENKDHVIKPIPYKEVEAIYPTKDDSRAFKLQQTLHEIHADEKKGENDSYEDLFFIINDPMGVAQDVAALLDQAQDKHRATVESIQTGESESKIFNRLQKKTNSTSSFVNTPYGQQANALFTNALTLHKLINCDEKIKDKYDKYLDYEKINTILAFSYRAKQRKRIKSVRQDFLKVLKSNYYKIHLNDGIEGNDQDTFQVRSIVASHLALLTEHEQHKDRFIDPPHKYKGNDDKEVDEFIEDSVTKNDALRKLLTKEFNIDSLTLGYIASKNGFTLARTLIKSMKDGATAYTRHAVRVKNFDIVDKSVKAFKTKSGWHIKIKTKAANTHLAKNNFGISVKTIEETANIFFDKKGKTIKIRTSEHLAQQAVKNKSINIPGQGLGTKTSRVLQDILDSPRFRKFMAGLELINTLIKVNSLVESDNWKNRTNLFGAVSSLSSAVLTYQDASMKLAGTASDDTIKLIGKAGRILGLVGSATSVAMCFIDTKDSLQLRDYDAAVASAFTLGISVVLLAEGIVSYSAWLATGTAAGFLSFGWTVVVFLLLIGGTALAIYLTDTALEKFLKNNILSNENAFNSTENIPYKYIKALYKAREDLVDSEVTRWRNFITASDDLYDLLISYKIDPQFSGMIDYKKKKEKEDESFMDAFMDNLRHYITQPAAGIRPVTYKKLVINITLQKFIYNISEFKYVLILYPKGMKNNNTNTTPLVLDSIKTRLNEDKNMNSLQVTFTLDSYLHKKMSMNSDFLLVSQTCINKETKEYWPSQRGKTRYHAYKFDATNFIGGTGMAGTSKVLADVGTIVQNDYLGANVRIGTAKEINDPNIWK